ncbi:MAG TPA: response regulator transcription factor [Ktedonobacteraceae bacterium]|nr:response regulator transcription factor [Ktedonobacteraceae bacterium]
METIEKSLRILVADDHLIVRKGLRLLLEEMGEGFHLVGEAVDGLQAIHLTGELQPDVVLMDVRMPGMDGLAAIEQIHQSWPQVAVVILTTYNDDEALLRGLQAGACGYILKEASAETLFHALRTAARGEFLLQPEVMARVLAQTRPMALPPREASAETSSHELTERERAILAAVARGERSKEIAQHLGISERTVKAHLTNIYTKLHVDSRASAVAVALERGLLR